MQFPNIADRTRIRLGVPAYLMGLVLVALPPAAGAGVGSLAQSATPAPVAAASTPVAPFSAAAAADPGWEEALQQAIRELMKHLECSSPLDPGMPPEQWFRIVEDCYREHGPPDLPPDQAAQVRHNVEHQVDLLHKAPTSVDLAAADEYRHTLISLHQDLERR